MNRGFTLIELIITIAISSLLAIGTFKAIKEIYLKSQKTKILTQQTIDTQSTIDQIGGLLYDRIYDSTIRYNPNSGKYNLLSMSSDENFTILEWIGRAREVENNSSSMFIDLNNHIGNNRYFSPLTNGSEINSTIRVKFHFNNIDVFGERDVNVIFPSKVTNLGWHGSDRNDSYDINISEDGYVEFNSNVLNGNAAPYALFYLVDSAYAVARGADVDRNAIENNCNLNFTFKNNSEFDNTLFLFYNYRPWIRKNGKYETFCADTNTSANREGNVTILMQNVTGFHTFKEGVAVRIKIDSYVKIKGASRVHISKQKVIF